MTSVHQGTHGSTSGAYTTRGKFNRTVFDDTFDMYSSYPHTHITLKETLRMVHGNIDAFDVVCFLPSILTHSTNAGFSSDSWPISPSG